MSSIAVRPYDTAWGTWPDYDEPLTPEELRVRREVDAVATPLVFHAMLWLLLNPDSDEPRRRAPHPTGRFA